MINNPLNNRSCFRKLRYLYIARQRVLSTPTAVSQTLLALKKTTSLFFTRRLNKVLLNRLYVFKKQAQLSNLRRVETALVRSGKKRNKRISGDSNCLLYSCITTSNTLLLALALDSLLKNKTVEKKNLTAVNFVQARVYTNIKHSYLNKQLAKIFQRALNGLRRVHIHKHSLAGKPAHQIKTINQRLLKLRGLNAARKLKKIQLKMRQKKSIYFKKAGYHKLARKFVILTQLGYVYDDCFFLTESGNFFKPQDKLNSCLWLNFNIILKLSEVVSRDAYIATSLIMLYTALQPYASLASTDLIVSNLKSTSSIPLAEHTALHRLYAANHLTLKRTPLLV